MNLWKYKNVALKQIDQCLNDDIDHIGTNPVTSHSWKAQNL
jgi:hypothetical protein